MIFFPIRQFVQNKKGGVLMALNDKQKIFADEYIVLGNAYQAALNAGYKESSAKDASKWINPEILKNPNERERKKYKPEVREYIDKRMAEKEKTLIADQDEVLMYLTSVLRGESQSTELVSESAGGITIAKEMKKAPSEKDRLKAAELLGKRYGIYTDRIQADVDMELSISIDYGDEEDGDA